MAAHLYIILYHVDVYSSDVGVDEDITLRLMLDSAKISTHDKNGMWQL